MSNCYVIRYLIFITGCYSDSISLTSSISGLRTILSGSSVDTFCVYVVMRAEWASLGCGSYYSCLLTIGSNTCTFRFRAIGSGLSLWSNPLLPSFASNVFHACSLFIILKHHWITSNLFSYTESLSNISDQSSLLPQIPGLFI